MCQNLITAGVVDPVQLPLDQVWIEVALVLKTSVNQIERLECWPNQIWVKLVEAPARFVSYRSLPLWIKQGLAAIERCTSRASLDQVGELLRTEREWYDKHEKPEAVQPWRNAWAQQAQHLREEEERLKPIRAHQQAGAEWQKAWQQILRHCLDCTSLEGLAPEIKRQSQEFVDLPDVMQAMQQLWHQRWQELTQVTT